MADYEENNAIASEEPIPETQETATEPIAQAVNDSACEAQANEQAAPADASAAPASASAVPASPYAAPANPYAAPASAYAAPTGAYERPEAPRGAYADAGYIPASDAGAMPKSYYCAAQTERKPKKERRARRGMHPAAVVALCLVCAILGGLAGGVVPGWMTKQSASETTTATAPAERSVTAGTNETTTLNVAGGSTKTVTTNTVLSGSEMSATDIYYNLALDQVVGVKTEITYTNVFGYTSKGAVSGSGFIISEDGYVLTNYHVIEDAVTGGYDVQVLTYNGETYIAEVIGYEPDNDVAVLKIDATGLNAAVLGDSDEIRVGEQVYAVGNPLGELAYSMTEGIVSAKDRDITTSDSNGQSTTINMFQTTAAINSGNSGGPIYNSRGQVIGISTAKTSATGVEGLGFAIPINDAVRIARDLITDGYVRGKAYMGVDIGTVTASAAQYYGLVQGAIVGSVEAGSCAETAGLQVSDIIVAIDGKEILTGNELIAAKKNYSAGDSAVLKVYREGQYLELTIVFDEATPTTSAPAEEPAETQEAPTQQQMSPEDLFRQFFGGSGSPFGK